MQTYQQLRGHGPDFIVKYRLYSPSEGGRKVTYQHLRCDFLYEGDDPNANLYMIHPEFLDPHGLPIPDGTVVPLVGSASMWVLVPEMRASVHRVRAKAGTRGHFMEGARKIADVEIQRIAGLHENPAA